MNDTNLKIIVAIICATIAYCAYVCVTHADGALLAVFMSVIGTFIGIPIGQHLEKRRVMADATEGEQ